MYHFEILGKIFHQNISAMDLNSSGNSFIYFWKVFLFFPPFIFEKLSVAHILRQSCSCQTEKVLLLWVHLNIEIQNEKYLLYCWGVTFHSLLFTRRRCSLAIAESLVTSCKIRSLLVTRCKSTCWSYPLQSYSLPVTHCIFTRCSLLVANSFVACYLL